VLKVDQVLVTDGGKIINLAELKLFFNGQQLSCLTIAISAAHPSFPVSNCNDGNVNNFCHSLSGDANPSLTITGISALDRVVVYNRVDCCQARIVGATISYLVSNQVMWTSTFVGTLSSYDFSVVTTGAHA
jgi:hypothetical protein